MIRLWQLSDRTLLRSFVGHSATIRSLAFSPDGSACASIGVGGEIRVWDVASGNSRFVVQVHPRVGFAIAFSPDGRAIASAGAEGTIRLWSAKDGQAVGTLAGHDGPVRSLAFGPGGRLVSGGVDKSVRIQYCSFK